MTRISRDHMLLAIAEVVAHRGTCSRLRVGAVASREGRVLSTGYNGAPKGLPHCDHSGSTDPLGCVVSVHAEANAVAFAARYGVSLDGAELHLTHSPCVACAHLIINSGIARVVYDESYRITAGVDLIGAAGITLARRGQDVE